MSLDLFFLFYCCFVRCHCCHYSGYDSDDDGDDGFYDYEDDEGDDDYLGFRALDLRPLVLGLSCRVQGFGFRNVQGRVRIKES